MAELMEKQKGSDNDNKTSIPSEKAQELAKNLQKLEGEKPKGKRGPNKKKRVTIDDILTDASMETLVGTPGVLLTGLYNDPVFLLEDAEKKEIAPAAKVVVKEFVDVDAKWIALIVFSLSMSSVYIPKFNAHYKHAKANQDLIDSELEDDSNDARDRLKVKTVEKVDDSVNDAMDRLGVKSKDE